MREWLVMVSMVTGCFTQPSPAPPPSRSADRTATTVSHGNKVGATCGPLASGRCYQRANCADGYECVDGPPGSPPAPHLRVTGMGASFGTDEQPCDRRPPTCPTGQVLAPIIQSNLCHGSECRPHCSSTSCAAGEECLREGFCRPIACNSGWTCAAGSSCGYGNRGTDVHGCTPDCPPPGHCVVRGPPIP